MVKRGDIKWSSRNISDERVVRMALLRELTTDGKGHYGIGAAAVEKRDDLYTYLRITDIKDDGTLNKNDLKSVDDLEASNYLLFPNDIVFARTGASTGRNYFYDGSDGEFVYAGFLIKFSIDPQKVNPLYIKYYCQSLQYRNWIKSFSTGSTRGNINAKTFGNMQIPLPPRKQQDFLAETLAPIDAKIKLNKAINDNLYAILQTFYQQRFNQFEQTAESKILADICNYSKDKVAISSLSLSTYYSTENMLPGKAGSVDASSLPAVAQTIKCKVGDVLISNIRPYFKKIVYCQSECGCSTDVLCFTPKTSKLSAYLYCTLYTDRFFDFMVAGSKGTKMPRGDKQQIMTYSVYEPTNIELETFNEVAQPILTQIESNRLENIELMSLRDSLISKLVSREIAVSSHSAVGG